MAYEHSVITLEQCECVVDYGDVMRWCNEHPDERLHCTEFVPKNPHTEGACLIMSEIDKMTSPIPPEMYPVENRFGFWKYISASNCYVWYCYDESSDRMIYITKKFNL